MTTLSKGIGYTEISPSLTTLESLKNDLTGINHRLSVIECDLKHFLDKIEPVPIPTMDPTSKGPDPGRPGLKVELIQNVGEANCTIGRIESLISDLRKHI